MIKKYLNVTDGRLTVAKPRSASHRTVKLTIKSI